MDIKDFYLGLIMEEYKYMKMRLKMCPKNVKKQYILMEHKKDGYVYLKFWQAIYGLLQAIRLANQ